MGANNQSDPPAKVQAAPSQIRIPLARKGPNRGRLRGSARHWLRPGRMGASGSMERVSSTGVRPRSPTGCPQQPSTHRLSCPQLTTHLARWPSSYCALCTELRSCRAQTMLSTTTFQNRGNELGKGAWEVEAPASPEHTAQHSQLRIRSPAQETGWFAPC